MIPDNQTLSSLNYKNPNGTVSVEVSSISADKAILTVKDFSFGNYEDLSIIIKETEFSESAPLDFSISDTSLILNLSSLRSHFEFRRSKEFRIYILGVHDQKAELFLLKDKSQKAAPWNNFHLFTEEIYFDEDSAIRPTEYIGVLSADSKDNLCIHLCSRNKYLAQTHYCSLRSLKMNGGKLKICYDLETGYHEYVKTELSFRNKLAEDAVTYDFTTLSTNKRGNLLRIKLTGKVSTGMSTFSYTTRATTRQTTFPYQWIQNNVCSRNSFTMVPTRLTMDFSSILTIPERKHLLLFTEIKGTTTDSISFSRNLLQYSFIASQNPTGTKNTSAWLVKNLLPWLRIMDITSSNTAWTKTKKLICIKKSTI